MCPYNLIAAKLDQYLPYDMFIYLSYKLKMM